MQQLTITNSLFRTKIMTKTKDFFKLLLLLVIASSTLCACGDDDDDDFNYNSLNSYIIGKWHSYKGVVSAEGEKETVQISKTGEFSAAYYEIDFQNNGTAIFYAWIQDQNGLSQWTQVKSSYQVQNDQVLLRDSSGETLSFTFDSKEKALYMRAVTDYYGIQATVFIYLRK